MQEARHRIELLSTELSNAKETVAREASRYEQTTELTTMLREAHANLAASNGSLRKECDALRNRYNMDADQWKVCPPVDCTVRDVRPSVLIACALGATEELC